MKQWLIYKHTSMKSGKCYIGMTSGTISSRWSGHLCSANSGSPSHFHRAIRLYGEDNWIHEVLASGIDTIEEAYSLEKYYIKKEDSFENGYNLTIGGEGNPGLLKPEYFEVHTWIHSNYPEVTCSGEDLIEKYSLPIDTMRSYLTSSSNSKSASGWVIKGRHKLPKKTTDKNDTIVLFHSKEGKFTGSVNDFSILTGKPINHITKLLIGKHKSLLGWRLTEKKHTVVSKEVCGFDINTGKLVVTYPSSFEASRQLRLSRKELMSEWLNYSGNAGKLYEGVVYKYKDNNIGVV